MTEGEKMIWAAAFARGLELDSLNGPIQEEYSVAVRNALDAAADTLRAARNARTFGRTMETLPEQQADLNEMLT